MLAVANDDFLDFLEGAGIDADAAGGYGIAAVGPVFGEFKGVAIFEDEDFAGDAAKLIGERGVTEEMSIFAVNGNEIFGFHQLQDEFLFFLARVAGDVNGPGGIVVINERA